MGCGASAPASAAAPPPAVGDGNETAGLPPPAPRIGAAPETSRATEPVDDEPVHADVAAADEAEASATAATRIAAVQRGKQDRARVAQLRAEQAAARAAAMAEESRVASLKAEQAREQAQQAHAATKIAAVQRGKRDRSRVEELRTTKQLEDAEQADAATKIAAVQRGKQDRLRVAGMKEETRQQAAEEEAQRQAEEEAARQAEAVRIAEVEAEVEAEAEAAAAASAAAADAEAAAAAAVAAAAAAEAEAAELEAAEAAAAAAAAAEAAAAAAAEAAAAEAAAAEAEAAAAAAAEAEAEAAQAEAEAEDVGVQAAEGTKLSLEPEPEQAPATTDTEFGPLPPPPLPAGYSGRPQVISGLLQAVTTAGEGAMAVRGQGGLGKTTIAAALVRHHKDELADRFPDGVFWLTLGEQIPSVTGLQASLMRGLGEAKQQVIRDEMAGAVLVARCLAGKRILLVLDDVWTDRHAKMFCSLPESGESGSVVMITTRIEGLLGSGQKGSLVGEHVLGSFSDADGENLLRSSAGATGWSFDDAGSAVLTACEMLPLAIAIVAGGITADGPHHSWADVSAALGGLDAAKTVVERAIEFNLATVDPATRQLYLELSIFPEDVWIPVAVLEIYSPHPPAAAAVQDLADRRLLQVRGGGAFAEVRLHDLQRAYVRDETSAVQQQELHGRLLSLYQSAAGVTGSEWWRCTAVGKPDAAFFCTWLAFHLVEFRGDEGRAEAASLLCEFAWLDTKLRATNGDVAAVLFDFRQFATDANAAIGLAFGQCAHIVESEPDQLAFQLAGRLPQNSACVAAARIRLEAGTIQAGGSSAARLVSFAPKPNLLTSTEGPLRQTMAAHTDWIRTLSVSADGMYLLSGSNDMTVKLWSLTDAQLVHHMQAHQHLVRGVAFVGGNKCGCSCAEDCKLIVYNLETGSVQREIVLGQGRSPVKIHCGIPVPLDPNQADVTPEHLSLSLSSVPNSETHVYVGYGVTVQLFDTSTGKLERELVGASSQIDDVTAASGTVACGCVDGAIFVWKGEETSAVHTITCPDECRSVSLSRDGLQLLAACDDTIARLWTLPMKAGVDVPAPKTLGSEETGHDDWIHCCALSAQGDSAVTGSDDGTLRLWQIPAKGAVSEVGKLTINTGVFACDLSGDDSMALSGSLDIKAWSIAQAEKESKATRSFGWHDGDVVAVAVADSKTGLSLGRTDGQLKVWNLTASAEDASEALLNSDTKKAFRRPKSADDEREVPTCIAVADDGELVAVGTDEAAVLIFELKAARGRGPKRLWPLHEKFEPHTDAIRGLAFAGTGHDQLVAVSEDGELSVIDADGPSVDIRLSLNMKPNCVAVGGTRALVGGWHGSLACVDVEEGEVIDLLAMAAETMPQPMSGRVQSTAVSADGKTGLAATAEEPGNPQLWLWNLDDKTLLRSWADLSDWVSRGLPCLLSDDAALGLTATWDQRLHVWDFAGGKAKGKGPVSEAASLLQLDRHPTCLAVSKRWGSDGSGALLVGDYEGGVHALRYTSN
jgi:WD40 repeat protein